MALLFHQFFDNSEQQKKMKTKRREFVMRRQQQKVVFRCLTQEIFTFAIVPSLENAS